MQEVTTTEMLAFARTIHADMVKNGFWPTDKARNHAQLCFLITTELAEACEADRKNRFANIQQLEAAMDAFVSDETSIKASMSLFPEKSRTAEEVKSAYFKECFEKNVKDTVGDEIADAAVRALDYIGFLLGDEGVNVAKYTRDKFRELPYTSCFPENLHILNTEVDSIYNTKENDWIRLYFLVSFVYKAEQLAHLVACDLWKHVEYKVAYNRLRSERHGGKKY